MLLDKFLPTYHFNEVHGITTTASPERVFQAIMEVTPAEIALLRPMFTVRSLPALLKGKRRRTFGDVEPMLQQAIGGGFVLLAAVPEREMVLGTIGQFWRASGGMLKVANGEEFLASDKADYAKAVMNFYVYTRGGITKVRTETRISISDPTTRRKFAAYWRVISPGSAILRIMWLRAIKKRAES